MKLLRKAIVSVLIVLALGIGALYVSAPYLVETLLTRQLQAQGFTDVVVQAGELRRGRLHLRWLSFASATGDIDWRLETRDVRLLMGLGDLFSANLPRLQADQLYLEFDSRSDGRNQAAEETYLRLPLSLISYLPLRSVDVHQLRLSWRTRQGWHDFTGSASLDRLADRLSTELTLARHDTVDAAAYTAFLVLTRSGQVVLSLAAVASDGPPVFKLIAKVQEHDDSIEIANGQLSVDSVGLEAFVRASGLLPLPTSVMGVASAESEFNGRISKRVRAGEPEFYRLDGRLELAIDALATAFYPQPAHGRLSAEFAVDEASSRLRVLPESVINGPWLEPLRAWAQALAAWAPLALDQMLSLKVVTPIEFDQGLPLTRLAEAQAWPFKGQLAAIAPLNGGEQWQLILEDPVVRMADVVRLQSQYRLAMPLPVIRSDAVSMADSLASVNGQIEAAADHLVVSLLPGSRWATAQLQLAEQRLSDLVVEVDAPLVLDYLPQTQRWSADGAVFSVASRALAVGETTLSPQPLKVRLEKALGVADKWSVHAKVEAEGLPLVGSKAALAVHADVMLNERELASLSTLQLAHSNIKLEGELAYQWQAAEGAGFWRGKDMEVAALKPLLAGVLPAALADKIIIQRGLVDAGVSLRLTKDQVTLAAKAQLREVSGSYDDILWHGASARLRIDDLLALSAEKASSIAIEKVDIGFPVEMIRLQMKPQRAADGALMLSINDVSARLLGGEISIDKIALFEQPATPFNVKVKGIDLARVVALQQQAGLAASGMLDGEIPVVLAGDTLTVAQGVLHARAPGGVIHYRSEDAEALAKTHQALGVALRTLEDFRYEVLDVSGDYLETGDLKLALSLVGRNPKFEQGRQVNLNINVEQNLKSLLKSLQLTRELSDKIGERVQQRLK